MNKAKPKELEYIPTPLHQYQKVNRWNICQAIAKVFYHRAITDDELLKIYHREISAHTTIRSKKERGK